MGVISSSEIAEQRRGPTFDGDGSLTRRYTRVFQVITNSYRTEGLQALIQGGAIPPLYSFYDTRPYGGTAYDAGALLVGYDPYQPDKDAPNLWYVRCDYSSKSLDPAKVSFSQGAGGSPEGGGGLNENPLLRPVQITYRSNNQRRTAYTASGYWYRGGEVVGTPFVDGNTAIKNTAGQPFNQMPEVIAPQKTLTIVKNKPSYNVNEMMFYEGKVNSTPFLGFDTATVFCDFIDGASGFENNIAFVTVTYQFSIRRDNFNPDSPGEPWDWAPINQGSYYLDDNDVEQFFTDSNGNFRQGFLDTDGTRLSSTLEPIILAFRVYERTDFNALGLP